MVVVLEDERHELIGSITAFGQIFGVMKKLQMCESWECNPEIN